MSASGTLPVPRVMAMTPRGITVGLSSVIPTQYEPSLLAEPVNRPLTCSTMLSFQKVEGPRGFKYRLMQVLSPDLAYRFDTPTTITLPRVTAKLRALRSDRTSVGAPFPLSAASLTQVLFSLFFAAHRTTQLPQAMMPRTRHTAKVTGWHEALCHYLSVSRSTSHWSIVRRAGRFFSKLGFPPAVERFDRPRKRTSTLR